MKIAVFYNLPAGGARRAAEEQIKRLRKKHKIDLYKLPPRYLSNLEGAPPLRQCKKLRRLKVDFFKFWILKKIHQKLAKKIDQKGYDVVLVHPSRFTQAPYLLRYLKTPTVYFCQEPLRIGYEYSLRFQEKVVIFKKIYEELTRLILKKIDLENARSATKILTNSYHSLESVYKAYGVYPQVCYLGVDTNHFRPLPGTKKEGILFVAKPARITGFEFLKKAVSLVKPEAKIKIVAGHLSEKKLVEAYNKAVLTACPSQVEPFGLVPLESMACQTPVVAVKEGGYRESIVEGITGFLVDRNPRAFAQKIKLLLRNQKLVQKIGKAGRKYVQKNWTWEKSVKQLEEKLFNTAYQNETAAFHHHR